MRFFLLPLIATIAMATSTHAVEFRDYYEPEDIAAYNDALKRKNFRAQIQHLPLMVAAADNADLNTVRWMLENGEKADTAAATGRTGLFQLASRNSEKIPKEYAQIARLLLIHGADPNRFALGTSVTRTLVAGNRDATTLQIVLDHGASPDGHPKDERPPVCAAATPAILDALVNAGAQLEFNGRTDFRNAADCLALENSVAKKERKVMLRHLAMVYGVVSGTDSSPTNASKPWRAEQAGTLPAGNYLYSEHHWATPAWQQKPAVTVNYVVVNAAQALPREAIIASFVQPERFRQTGWHVAGVSLQRCAKRCDEELAGARAFADQNRLTRTWAQHAQAEPKANAVDSVAAAETSAAASASGEAQPAPLADATAPSESEPGVP